MSSNHPALIARVFIPLAGVLGLAAVGSAHGGVVLFGSRDEWVAAVGRFTTVDFTGFPNGTFITEQYAELGIHFTDGNDSVFLNDVFLNDDAGLDGNGDIDVSFDTPQLWLAADFPGIFRYQLFWQGELIYESGGVGGGGKGFFVGLLSDEPFDAAILDAVLGEVSIDDLHFGVPAPAGLWLLALAVLNPRRRR